MKNVNVYAGRNGWFYEVWVASRLVVLGWCPTRERAAREACSV